MANTKISALTLGNPAQSGDLLPIDRSGANFSITAGSVASLAGAILSIEYIVTNYGCVGNGSTDNTVAMKALLTTIGSTVATICFPQGTFVLGTSGSPATGVTFPANITLDFTAGGSIKVTTGDTVTIAGPVIAERQQIFNNATATLGTISFAGNYKTSTFFPEWWGALANGSNNDLAALQACSNAILTIQSISCGIVSLSSGNYLLGSGTWEIGNAGNPQNHIAIMGTAGGAGGTQLISYNTGTTPVIYLNNTTNCQIKDFTLQGLSITDGIGFAMGGGASTGLNTANIEFTNVGVVDFNHGWDCSGGLGTSASITLSTCIMYYCTAGVFVDNDNALAITLINPTIYFCTVGVDCGTSGVSIYGGAGSHNGTDISITNFGVNVISQFYSEVAGMFLNHTGSAACMTTVENCQVDALTGGNTTPAISIFQGSVTVSNCLLMGTVVMSGPGVILNLVNNQICDASNTYTATATPAGMGPGFRCSEAGGVFNSTNNMNITTPGFNPVVNSQADLSIWPSGRGLITVGNIASMTGYGQGAALTVSSNTISPTSYAHHVGSGLIKTIALPADSYTSVQPNQWFVAIADGTFSTDTTSNIALAINATVGQVVLFAYDPGTGLWYPSYVNPNFASMGLSRTSPALVAHTGAAMSSSVASLTTSAINTTGSNLLVVAGNCLYNTNLVVTDSFNNTWQALILYGNTGTGTYFTQISYCYSPTVGAGHTFTLTPAAGAGYYSDMEVLAFSNMTAGSTVYQASSTAGNHNTSSATLQPGSVTPANTGDLIITALSTNEYYTNISINDGFIITDRPEATSQWVAGAAAYLVTTSTNAVNPTWSTGQSGGSQSAAIAVFKSAPSLPTFTGSLGNGTTAATQAALDDSALVATTAYTDSAVGVETSRAEAAEALKLPLAGGTMTGAIEMTSGLAINWNADSGISRLGAASLAIGNGTAGDYSGSLRLTDVSVLTNNASSPAMLNVQNTNSAAETYIGVLNDLGSGIYVGICGSTYAISTFRNAALFGVDAGTSAATSFIISTNTNLSSGGTAPISFVAGGFSVTPQLTIQPSGAIQIGGSDTCISRLGAASIAVGNGTASDVSGSLSLKTILMTASAGAPTSAGTAGTAGQIIYYSGLAYLCTVTGSAGSATWNKLNLTAV
jgi:hypothetical protein